MHVNTSINLLMATPASKTSQLNTSLHVTLFRLNWEETIGRAFYRGVSIHVNRSLIYVYMLNQLKPTICPPYQQRDSRSGLLCPRLCTSPVSGSWDNKLDPLIETPFLETNKYGSFWFKWLLVLNDYDWCSYLGNAFKPFKHELKW